MNNKPIIDGIDVSECRFFQRQYIEDMYESDDCNVCIDDFCTICFSECAEKDCYYKQLKRLQKENEELKSLLDFEIQKREVFADKSIKYEFALEEIKENICKIDDVDKWIELDLLPTDVCEEIKQINNKINEVLHVENN